ncbi:response regulator [Vibrio sp. SM6]|uniref:Response regulator n=1 Tax=Vibrio agarilyticus TaxID=2726741 RepID=A0A7X8TNY1_9VIBR|nr:response regulator [Vibrio agarilyticus]NLS12045.1 response regulator [Vibrio agarilyticus]
MRGYINTRYGLMPSIQSIAIYMESLVIKGRATELKVLIIDDSRPAAVLVRQQLVSMGLHRDNVYSVVRYEDALPLLDKYFFHLLIIDYHLEQALNGFELVSVLHQNRRLNDKVGILIISGDATQQTVLTALSGKVKHFISKPIKTRHLEEKIDQILGEIELKEALGPLLPIERFDILKQALNQPVHPRFAIAHEALILDDLMSNANVLLLKEALTQSQTSNHATKAIAQAVVLQHHGEVGSAIELLHQFLIENPLSIRILDQLSLLYQENHNHPMALKWAIKAFELTPSISKRAIRASFLAAQLKQKETLVKIGYTFAGHISLADQNWLNAVLSYLNDLGSVYTATDQNKSKKLLLKHTSNFAQVALRRLTPQRIAQLNAAVTLFQTHILLHEQNPFLAHQKLFKSLSFFYQDIFACPSLLLEQYINSFLYFGEFHMHKELQQINQQHQSTKCAQAEFVNDAVTPPNDIHDLEVHLQQYPYSAEAKMHYMHRAQNKLKNNKQTHQYRDELNQLHLPPNWGRWLKIHQHRAPLTAPPTAFSISTPAEPL